MENFLGFEDNEEIKSEEGGEDGDAAMDGGQNYREHLELSELLLGIK